MNNEIPIIEVVADAIYLVVLGNKKIMNSFVEKINNNKTKYMVFKIDIPIAIKCKELHELLNTNVTLGTDVEIAQCYTYAEGYENKNYMLMCMENNNNNIILTFPKIKLNENDDPEETIYNWLKKKKVSKSVKKTIKPITLVGEHDEILVFAVKLIN